MFKNLDHALGIIIRSKRLCLSLTQKDIADHVGVSKSSDRAHRQGITAVFAYYPPITVVISGAFWRIYS